MRSPLRPEVASLPVHPPGRAVRDAARLGGNEMPVAPLPEVVDAVAGAAADANRYPDIAVEELTARLAERHGVEPGRIAVACGSVALCQQLALATCAPGTEVVMAWPSFEAYPLMTLIGHAEPVRVPLDARSAHDLDAMADAVTDDTRMVFVCNPNNPTGTVVGRRALESFLARVPEHVLIVLDEAYHEFVTDPDVPDGVDLLDAHPHLVVLRTFSKAHRLAGLRVGYAVGPAAVTAALRAVAVPFSVNAAAQAAALAALDRLDVLLADCAAAARERDRVAAALRGLGYAVPPSQTNFVWLPLADRSEAFAEHARQHGVLVRAIGDDGVRASMGTTAEDDRLLAAAESFPG